MLLAKILWITGTRAHPVCGVGKTSSRIAISVLEADKPAMSGDIEEGFCVQPQSEYSKKLKVDDILNCATKKSSWTMSLLKSVRDQAQGFGRPDEPELAIRSYMPRQALRKAFRKYHKKE